MASGNGHDPDIEAVRFALKRSRTLARSDYYGGLAAFCGWQEDGLEALSRLETRLGPRQPAMPLVCALSGHGADADGCDT